VISHAGVGSIICALRAGHVPVIFPRLKRYGETVDDHQAELAEALASRGDVRVAWTGAELVEAVATAPARSSVPLTGGTMLGAAVHAAVRGETRATRRGLRRVAA
jgi:UDP-N-acetylglucosamine transferase subunit ALG13